MSARLSGAVTVINAALAVLLADAGDAWGAAFVGAVAGGWFITFIDKVWP